MSDADERVGSGIRAATRRWMALDVGERRVGVALSDPLLLTASPLEVVDATDAQKARERIAQLVTQHDVGKVVVGLPRRTTGEDGPEVERVRAWVEELRRLTLQDVEFVLWDERYTTTIAQQTLLEAGMRRNRRRRVVDKVAAAVLLQSYIRSQEQQGPG